MAIDADFDKVSLLLHCDGADGSTTFNDRSPTAKAIAASGNAKVSAAAAYALSGTVTQVSTPWLPTPSRAKTSPPWFTTA